MMKIIEKGKERMRKKEKGRKEEKGEENSEKGGKDDGG